MVHAPIPALMSPTRLRGELRRLHKERVDSPGRHEPRRLGRLTVRQRVALLSSTGGRCHICGGVIALGEPWQADHVLARSSGGTESLANYLPAHNTCNNYRWDYLPDEF